ncbi:divalent metal cation transporter MntH [Halalkalicoccus paucihalophilus]|uniref:Divalent metal cation transporter MntH n=1 Tax=Halalkalicoccus paucihalophilus TaxID=1008153 RepID=A0A151ADB1_9EURY|nr:divalent metal cation transporter [Halalkalicoccus paucihalophilus]KYH25347.1 divalent metal cation transporter MntH [Halalkalicoccus paucihalophilus]
MIETAREYGNRLGPTWLAGAIAAGPATMASLLSAGAGYGYTLLWVVILSALLGAIGQLLAARLGLFTEQGIVSTVETHLGEGWAWVLVVDVVLAAGLAQLVIMKTVADVSAALTGIDARLWGVLWALVLAVGLAGGGYRIAEVGAKALVSFVVVLFVATAIVVPIDPGAAASGLVPRIPAGLDGALVAAGVLGGAVHITLLVMQSYTMRARDWTRADQDLARFDVGSSMLLAFGGYSLAIFLVAASVLHTPAVDAAAITAIGAGQALEPAVGTAATWLFLLGLLGAAVSTLGGNTVVPPYALADKLGWGQSVADPRYRALVVCVALASSLGAFLGGSFFALLVLVLAFGLVGTPFAIVLILLLLNDPAVVEEPLSLPANLAGLALLGVALVTTGTFVREQAAAIADPLSAFVVAFAAGIGLATALLLVRFVRTARRPATVEV